MSEQRAIITAEQASQGTARALEKLVVNGDLTSLSPTQRVQYYIELCHSLGLNPASRPFDYLELNRKTVLYARKDCTDQLRNIRGVSISSLQRDIVGDLYVVTAEARMPDGRTDSEIGAVSIKGLQGEALANAMMKAVTKAKRRVTLSICGLGMLDETEVSSIPDARAVVVDENGEIHEPPATARQANGKKPMPLQKVREMVWDLLWKADWTTAEVDALAAQLEQMDEEGQRTLLVAMGQDLKAGRPVAKPTPAPTAPAEPQDDFTDPFAE